MPSAQPKSSRSEHSRARIIDAAIRCIETHGLEATTMEQVAAEAGVVRKTVYLSFGSRTALLDAVLAQRIGSNAAAIRKHLASCSTFAEALVNGCVKHVQLIRKDRVLLSLVENAHSPDVERYLLGSHSPVAGKMLSIWQDAFDKARAQGEIRDDLSDAEIATWLRAIAFMLRARSDLSVKGQRELLTKFVLPSLLR